MFIIIISILGITGEYHAKAEATIGLQFVENVVERNEQVRGHEIKWKNIVDRGWRETKVKS